MFPTPIAHDGRFPFFEQAMGFTLAVTTEDVAHRTSRMPCQKSLKRAPARDGLASIVSRNPDRTLLVHPDDLADPSCPQDRDGERRTIGKVRSYFSVRQRRVRTYKGVHFIMRPPTIQRRRHNLPPLRNEE